MELASPLFNALVKVPRDILLTPPMYGGVPAKRQTITFYEGDESAANAYMNKFGDKGIHARPYSQAPPELNALRSQLQQMSKTGNRFSLCYINYYADEKTQIGLHQDREEANSPHALVMVTLGGGRLFSIWKAETIDAWKAAKKKAVAKARTLPKMPAADWEEETKHGDLVVMPVGFHNKDGFYHAVLPQRQFAAARFSLTFRNPDLSAAGPWAREPFPCDYVEDFLSKEEADALLKCLDAWPYEKRHNPRNRKTFLRRQGVAFVSDPTHVQIRFKRQGLVLLDDAPPEIKSLRERLSGHIGRDVNYLSINKYPDGKVGIDWHNHTEDKGIDTPVLLVSVGAERNFWVRTFNGKHKVGHTHGKEVSQLAKHGSLVVMPATMNETHQHAILPDKTTTVRYSVNAKCLVHTPRVWNCHAGKEYPADAIYVGCCVRNRKGEVIREGTIFGNAKNPLASHHGWLKTEEEFRDYAIKKLEDPAFRQQAEQLRGKHLLCWCVQDGPKRAKFCHARVWLELANRKAHKKVAYGQGPHAAIEPKHLLADEQLVQIGGETK